MATKNIDSNSANCSAFPTVFQGDTMEEFLAWERAVRAEGARKREEMIKAYVCEAIRGNKHPEPT